MEDGTYFWLIMPEYYDKINDLTGSNFDEIGINFFKKKCKKGVYITVTFRSNESTYCSYMNYSLYSKEYFIMTNCKYICEFSRKSKLKKLEKI